MPGRSGRFQGLGTILLQPYDEDLDYTFEFEIATAADANDGAIPFGQNLGNARCEIYKHPEKIDYTTEILGTVVNTIGEDPEVVTIPMSYPYVTLLSLGEVANATTIDVDSTAGMVIGDRIGIVLNTGVIHWDIISAVTSAFIIEITVGLAGAAAATNKVFVPRIVKGKYHLTIVCYFSAGGDKEFNFNRVFVRDI